MTAADFTPYVPLLVRQWLDAPGPETRYQVLNGSAVFADISGFTRLSERLSRIGVEGAEQVTGVIGSAFGRLLEPAYAFEGSLLKFGGDSILLLFRGDGHELRAASAALGMRRALRAMGPIETTAGNVTLQMSQGVHSGEFHFFLIGSSFRQLVIAGSAMTQLARVEGEAGAGRIISSEANARALPASNLGVGKDTGRLLRGTLLSLPHSNPSGYSAEHDLAPFVASAVREPIEHGAVVSEHRPASVAFIRFSALDALLDDNPEAAVDALTKLVDDVEMATELRHVALLDTDVYPDGLKILLSAGAPVTTGEDEENMLLAIREVVGKDRPLPLHIGVNRGPVFAGDVGTAYRRTYTVMGDTVNLAARLMARAGPGQVLATDSVLRGSRTTFRTKALEPFSVKGKEAPVTAFDVGEPAGSRPEASGRPGRIVGRDMELEAMLRAGEEAGAGRGSALLVGGDPGIGKTALISGFAGRLDGVRLYRAVGRRYRQSTPYFGVGLLLRDIMGIGRDSPEQAERLAQIVESVDPDLLPYLSLIGTAIGLDLPESPEVAALAEEFRTAQLQDSVDALMRGLLTEASLLWIDDVQWIDEASLGALAAFSAAAATRPWMVIASGRGAEEIEVLSGSSVTTVVLGPLTDEDTIAVVHELTDKAPLHPHLTARIVDRANGNPMILRELLSALGPDGDVDALPESIEGLIAARIDRLLPEDRNALRRLSVLGTEFKPENATLVLHEGAPPETVQRLGEFLEVDPVLVRFTNTLVHAAAYAGLPYRQRRHLHGVVAEAIRQADGSPDLLSFHYHAAGRWQEAWENSLMAGDRAKDIFANIEAAALYQRAIDSAKRSDDVTVGEHAGALESLGDVRDLAGLYEDSSTAYRGARKLVKGQPMDEARLALKQSFLQEHQGHLPQALRWIRSGHKSLDGITSVDANATRAQLTVWYGTIRARQGRFKEALSWAKQGAEEASLADDQRALARAYLTQDYAEFALGLSREPEYSLKALAIYEEVEDFAGVGTAANNIGGYAYFASRWDDARRFYEQSEEARCKIGDPINAAVASSNTAEILTDQGQLVEAEQLLRDARRVFQSSNDPGDLAFTERLLGLALSRQHRFAEADELFESACAGFDMIGEADAVVENDLYRIESLVSRRATDDALALIYQTVDTVDPSKGLGPFQATLHRLWGEALTQNGSLDVARTHFETAEAAARDEGADFELALTLSALADLDRLERNPVRAAGIEERDAIFENLGVVAVVQPVPEPV